MLGYNSDDFVGRYICVGIREDIVKGVRPGERKNRGMLRKR